ncbi:MAG: hypothetical protein GF381_04605 [Candidatus Pacebacteria bacterium]|nr:hypothetical protein [Candidatus Paceibacterota bacterium]
MTNERPTPNGSHPEDQNKAEPNPTHLKQLARSISFFLDFESRRQDRNHTHFYFLKIANNEVQAAIAATESNSGNKGENLKLSLPHLEQLVDLIADYYREEAKKPNCDFQILAFLLALEVRVHRAIAEARIKELEAIIEEQSDTIERQEATIQEQGDTIERLRATIKSKATLLKGRTDGLSSLPMNNKRHYAN